MSKNEQKETSNSYRLERLAEMLFRLFQYHQEVEEAVKTQIEEKEKREEFDL